LFVCLFVCFLLLEIAEFFVCLLTPFNTILAYSCFLNCELKNRHVSSDLSNITYSGYLLKRSNQAYTGDTRYINPSGLDHQHHYHQGDEAVLQHPTAATVTFPIPNLLNAPDVPVLFAPSSASGGLSNTMLLRPKVDWQQQLLQQQQTLILGGDGGGGDGHGAPWSDLDESFPSSDEGYVTQPRKGGGGGGFSGSQRKAHGELALQQQEQQQAMEDETDQPAVVVAKNPLEQGLEFCAAFFGIKLGDDEEKRKRDNNNNNNSTNQGRADSTAALSMGSNGSSSKDLRYNPMQQQQQQIPPPTGIVKKKSAPIKVVSSSSLNAILPTGGGGATGGHLSSSASAGAGWSKRESFQQALHHRQSSAPLTSSSSSPPVSYIDPIDGHLWRAKYCVLEDGVLYFYRNPSDAKCTEAILERRQCRNTSLDGKSDDNNDNTFLESGSQQLYPPKGMNNNNNNNVYATMTRSSAAMTRMPSGTTLSSAASAKDLSKSPMAGRSTFREYFGSSADNAYDAASGCSGMANSGALWEKRVFLNCVGAVRSAELEYGKNSFELVAINEGDNDRAPQTSNNYHIRDNDEQDEEDEESNSIADKLVLQAHNSEEMNEWLFQFHRSLASFLMNLMDEVGSKSRGAYSDMHYPKSYHEPLKDAPDNARVSERAVYPASFDARNRRMSSLSPRFHHQASGSLGGHSLPHATSLSHGHGRNALHRRRAFGSSSAGGTGENISGSYHSSGNHMKSSFSENETSSLSSTPETAGGSSLGGGSIQMPFAFREPSPFPASGLAAQFRFSPGRTGSPEQPFLLRPPQPKQQQHQQPVIATKNDLWAPEYSAPQSQQDPETERPAPTKTTGKYIPPHMRAKQQQEQQGSGGGAANAAAPKSYVPPHLRKPPQESSVASGKDDHATNTKYMPPHMRNAGNAGDETKMAPTMSNPPSLLSLAERAMNAPQPLSPVEVLNDEATIEDDQLDIVGRQSTPFKRGGCADPQVVQGSILDTIFIPKKASKMGPIPTEAFGCFGGGDMVSDGRVSDSVEDGWTKMGQNTSSLRWEVGAVSECGIRNSNEDSYLISCNLIEAFRSLPPDPPGDDDDATATPVLSSWSQTHSEADHDLGLFAVFDGHCGDQAARFAAEKLAHFIHEGSKQKRGDLVYVDAIGMDSLQELAPNLASHTREGILNPLHPSNIEQVLGDAVVKLDKAFCHLCVEEGREWESGATALVAMLAKEHLVIANLGDCRGVLCRYVESDSTNCCNVMEKEWSELGASGDRDEEDDYSPGVSGRCMWKEVTNNHSPGKEEERIRIEQANGWVTTETEIPIGQLRRMDFLDADVIDILKRCFNDRCQEASGSVFRSSAPQRILHIFRVCGELSVSRALGDRDFKAAHNSLADERINGVDGDNVSDAMKVWDCPLYLPYPDSHSKRFQGDLVSNTPDFHRVRVGEEGVSDEFLLLACDGLWDVMDTDDAVRVTRDLLFRKKWTAKKAVRNQWVWFWQLDITS
jgi:serine/threonine protein phosphatase PrpC